MYIIHLQHISLPAKVFSAVTIRGIAVMAAFVIVDIADIHDEQVYAEYRRRVQGQVEAFGGTYLARTGAVEVLEGDWRPKRAIVVRFDSLDAARRWWHDPQYSELKDLRQRSTTTNMILVEGIPNA